MMNPQDSAIDCVKVRMEESSQSLITRVGSFGSSWLLPCYKLRYCYFVEQRCWVDSTDIRGELETDRYDENAHHIAVFEGEHPIAYLRVLPCFCESGIMLDHEFASILSDSTHSNLEREGAVELSRLVVAPHLQRQHLGSKIHPVEHLLKALYHLALNRNYNRFYIVVEDGWPQVFARRFGLPFQVIGAPYIFPDGTRTVAAVATLDELEAGMRHHSAAKYGWYRSAIDKDAEDKDADS